MAVWTIVTMAVLAVIIGIFVFLTFMVESENKKEQQSNILYPFSGHLSPPSPPWEVNKSSTNLGVGKKPEDGLFLVGMAGGNKADVPQIQCPVGTKINIVGAFLDITDPYGECSNNSNSTLRLTCGDASNVGSASSCKTEDDCAPGMNCVSGKCLPQQCNVDSDCGGYSSSKNIRVCPTPSNKKCSSSSDCESGVSCMGGTCSVLDPGSGPCMTCLNGHCASMPTCINSKNGLNETCSPIMGDKFHCRPRDASAYLAKYCDGKTTCLGSETDLWTPNTAESVFGPLPCHISAKSSDPNYASLPIITGWGGGTPDNSKSGDSNSATFNQGYYVHGLYTCVPDDENAKTS